MVLQALDLQTTIAKQERVHLDGDLSIEHVMPHHGLLRDGPLQDEPAWSESAGDNRGRMIHSFGNLTLLTQKRISAVIIGPFDKKRPEIAKNGHLRLNTYFQDFEGKAGIEDEIRKRGEELYGVAKTVWPGPNGSS